MLEVKVVTIDYVDSFGYGCEEDLISYTNTENGKISYVWNYDNVSSRDELNYIYKNRKNRHKNFKTKTVVETKDIKEYKDYCKGMIDPYVDYIEDGNQWRSVCERNNKYNTILVALKEIE